MTSARRIWVVAVAGAVGIWATSALGFWQLRRASGKEVLQQRIDAAARAEPTMPGISALADPATLVYRHLRLRGRWLPDDAVYLDNRPQSGQAGFYVLMPLRLEEAAAADVVVNRGWTPRNANDRTRIASYRTPEGVVEVTGVALAEEPRLLELSTPVERPLKGVWQNFDFDAYAKASGRPVLPIVVRQDPATGASDRSGDDGLSRDWPDRGGVLQSQIDRHHGYAFQWFALTATLVVLLLHQVFAYARHVRTVRH